MNKQQIESRIEALTKQKGEIFHELKDLKAKLKVIEFSKLFEPGRIYALDPSDFCYQKDCKYYFLFHNVITNKYAFINVYRGTTLNGVNNSDVDAKDIIKNRMTILDKKTAYAIIAKDYPY